MTGHGASFMGRDKIRYLVFLNGRWRWSPKKVMREAGFRLTTLSPGLIVDGKNIPSPDDKQRALRLNEDWDRHRMGLPAMAVEQRRYPKGSIGDGYLRAMALRETERRNKDIAWSKEQHSRDDWPRAWKWIGPIFGDCDPNTVRPEDLIGDIRNPDKIGLHPLVTQKVSLSEAHRVIKVWRALWKKMATFPGFGVDAGKDPSLAFANSAPLPREAVWLEGEAVRLVKRAWREGYHGLAALLAVAWDSQLSPVDARSLHAEQKRQDGIGVWFDLARAKTGRGAKATLGRRATALLLAYLERLGVEMVGKARIFRNRSGRPYSKDTLGDDFRDVRTMVFGPGEKRQLADFRRSGSVEAFAGNAGPEKVSAKMANSLSTSNRLHKTYAPVQLASVREVDEARARGRAKLRASGEQKGIESLTAPDQKSNRRTK